MKDQFTHQNGSKRFGQQVLMHVQKILTLQYFIYSCERMVENFKPIDLRSQHYEAGLNLNWSNFYSEEDFDSESQADSKQVGTRGDTLFEGFIQYQPRQYELVTRGCDQNLRQNLRYGVTKIEKKHQLNQHLFRHVFQKKKSQKKNTNFIKFLVAAFGKHLKKLGPQLSSQHNEFLQMAKKKYEKKGKRYIQIQALELLFGNDMPQENFKKINRQKLFQFLGSQEFLIHNVAYSKFITKSRNKKQHLLASKIYRLRCKSANLSQRVQTK